MLLAHIFIWVAWRGEGTLLSKLPFAAVTDKQADCRRNVSSLPTAFFKSSLVSSEHTYKRMLLILQDKNGMQVLTTHTQGKCNIFMYF